MALFLCPYDSSGGLRAEAFWLAGFLVGRSTNRVQPALLRLERRKADLLKTFSQGDSSCKRTKARHPN
ncbi:conserved domain protein [delta proteobacterium NaphS2]|nr:conserved domain protein [delta proteobacterium NaphS2]